MKSMLLRGNHQIPHQLTSRIAACLCWRLWATVFGMAGPDIVSRFAKDVKQAPRPVKGRVRAPPSLAPSRLETACRVRYPGSSSLEFISAPSSPIEVSIMFCNACRGQPKPGLVLHAYIQRGCSLELKMHCSCWGCKDAMLGRLH